MKSALIICAIIMFTNCHSTSKQTRKNNNSKDKANGSLFISGIPFFVSNSKQNLLTCDHLRTRAKQREVTLYDLTYGTSSFPSCAPPGWNAFFFHYKVKKAIKMISDSLVQEIEYGYHINPPIGSIFRALVLVPIDHVRVVILGDTPTSREGVASGLAFSLEPTVPAVLDYSTHRLLLEVRNEGFCVNAENGDLTPWGGRGVLLINSAFSIRIGGSSSSHSELWRPFTTELVKFINTFAKPSAWILFGKKAQSFGTLIDRNKHYVIKGGDPSPSTPSKQFFCGNYFNCANKWLSARGRGKIDWNLIRNSPACLPVPHKPFIYTTLTNDVVSSRVTLETECKMRPCASIS